MLRKLLKYEFKVTGRRFLPLYAALILVSVFMNLSLRNPNSEILGLISVMLFFALLVSVAIITLTTIIKRFKDNFLSDEGYLTFTLPVSTEKLILSKLISAFAWSVLSSIVTILSFAVMLTNKEVLDSMKAALSNYYYFFDVIGTEHYIAAAAFAVMCIFSFTYFVLLIYSALSIGQIPIFNKHRGAVAFVYFIAATIVVNTITSKIVENLFSLYAISSVSEATNLFIVSSLIYISLSIIFFFITDFMLKVHLNLE